MYIGIHFRLRLAKNNEDVNLSTTVPGRNRDVVLMDIFQRVGIGGCAVTTHRLSEGLNFLEVR